MTQEEKQLLYKDLCSRLPYGVMVNASYYRVDGSIYTTKDEKLSPQMLSDNFERFKPYLRSISTMMKEEMVEYSKISNKIGFPYKYFLNFTDWLNEHHFDYRGLIVKGLALEAPKNMYK